MAVTADPALGPLKTNAPGLKPTMAITSTSSAFNAGLNATCLAADQRGAARPAFTTCDIGAYEAQKLMPTLTTRASGTIVVGAGGVTGTGTISGGYFPTGTFRWIASYSGDGNNNPAFGPCSDPPETTTATPQLPTLDPMTLLVLALLLASLGLPAARRTR